MNAIELQARIKQAWRRAETMLAINDIPGWVDWSNEAFRLQRALAGC